MLSIGDIIEGKYKIMAVLGKGGMGTVYLAKHIGLGTTRAIKELCRKDRTYSESFRQGIFREIHIWRRLSHPNLPGIMDVIIYKDSFLIVMEYIEGKTLKELLEEKEYIEEETALQWAREICDVLNYLHTRVPPVIYRDLKPSNLMLKTDGRLMLIDFGTAREYREKKDGGDTVCLGTRGYAAPEQYAENGQTDARTDIYCFGATMYHLLTGKSPEKPPYKMYPIRYWNPDFSLGLEAVILKCTRQNPDERYQNCGELAYALCHLQEQDIYYRRRERNKIKVFLYLLAGMTAALAGAQGCRFEIKKELTQAAGNYVSLAEKSFNRNTMKHYYKEALALLPAEKGIYKSLLKQYVNPNDFREEDAAELLNIIEEAGRGKPVLDSLKKAEPGMFCEFCYTVGIGYFYHMGTVVGKKEAGAWFEEVISTDCLDFSAEKRERARLYREISGYYATFIENGADRSGEHAIKNYKDFFDTLCQLNQIRISTDSQASEIAAAYLISMEVAAEISAFGQQFMGEGGITAKELYNELEKICPGNEQGGRIQLLRAYRDETDISNLKAMVSSARSKIYSIKEGEED